jgi:hypothetical protein
MYLTRKFYFTEKEPSKFSMIFSQKLQENRNNNGSNELYKSDDMFELFIGIQA